MKHIRHGKQFFPPVSAQSCFHLIFRQAELRFDANGPTYFCSALPVPVRYSRLEAPVPTGRTYLLTKIIKPLLDGSLRNLQKEATAATRKTVSTMVWHKMIEQREQIDQQTKLRCWDMIVAYHANCHCMRYQQQRFDHVPGLCFGRRRCRSYLSTIHHCR